MISSMHLCWVKMQSFKMPTENCRINSKKERRAGKINRPSIDSKMGLNKPSTSTFNISDKPPWLNSNDVSPEADYIIFAYLPSKIWKKLSIQFYLKILLHFFNSLSNFYHKFEQIINQRSNQISDCNFLHFWPVWWWSGTSSSQGPEFALERQRLPLLLGFEVIHHVFILLPDPQDLEMMVFGVVFFSGLDSFLEVGKFDSMFVSEVMEGLWDFLVTFFEPDLLFVSKKFFNFLLYSVSFDIIFLFGHLLLHFSQV